MKKLKQLSKKGLTLLLAVLLVASMFLPVAIEEVSAATVTKVTYVQNMTGYGQRGVFTIDGKTGLCCEIGVTEPRKGASYSARQYVPGGSGYNANVAKILYYGWGGPGNIYGSDADNGVTGTSAALDKYIGQNGSYEYDAACTKKILNYIASKPTPNYTYYIYSPTSGNTQKIAAIGSEYSINVNITINKTSGNPSITDGNSCYSLEGAKYGVYNGSTLVATMTTDANGTATGTVRVPASAAKALKVKELSPPKGYALDEKIYTINGSSGSATLNVTDRPEADPIAMLVNKVDADTGAPVPTGNGTSLGGAQFTVKFYYGIDWTEDPALSGEEPIRIWIFETDESGYCSYGEKWFVSGDEFWYDELKTATLPLGTITVQETKAPTGYLINEEIFVMKTTGTGLVSVDNQPLDAALVNEQVKKGDIEFIKIDSETEEPLEGVVFEIIDAVTGEVVKTITTDKNGYATTAEEDKPEGTIPYGKYFIHETAPLKGYHALEEDVEVSITENGQTTEGLVIENDPKLGLIVMDDNIKLFGKDGMIEFITGDNMRNVVSVAAILMLLAVFGIIYIVRKNKKETDVN